MKSYEFENFIVINADIALVTNFDQIAKFHFRGGYLEPMGLILVRNAVGRDFHSATKSIFSNYLKNAVSGHKMFLAPN
mgnify:CR=1 FL=1